MKDFNFKIPQNIQFGMGSLKKLPEILAENHSDNILLVSDRGLEKIGVVKKVQDIIEAAGLKCTSYLDVVPNPTVAVVNEATALYKECGATSIVALGGGSSMDVGKAVGVLVNYGGKITDYEGNHKVPGPIVPMIAIPTTAGTGSEVTASAVITDTERNYKLSVFSYEILPKYAVLDPELIMTAPASIAASCGVDALIHAMEAYVSRNATPFSDAMAEKAMELIEELYIRVTSNVWFQSTQMAYIFGGYYRYPHLDVGGLDENGKDASNELSYLCLRAMRYAKTTSPAVSILLHQKTPDSLLYEACELAAEGMGHPSFFNCEGLYAMLEHRAGGPEGYSNYTRKDILKFGSPIGCVEPGAEGLQYGHTDSGIINVAGATLMAVTNGIMPEGTDNMFAGKLLTYESGAPETFETFDQFYAAVKAQIKYAIDEAHANLLVCEKLLAEQFNLPTFTVLLEGALEKAKDATAGGAKVNVGPTMNMSGFGTMVDSVAAIKKVVYTDHKATLAQVRDACMANFQGYEDLRIQLQAAPKYGNDDDFADDIAADLWEWFAQCTMGLKMYRGHYCDAAVQMVQSNVGYGAMTGATPNGRLAGMPLSDTMSATQQADTHGPTAAARSYGKLDFPVYTNGTLLNMWISQSELMEKQ